MGQESLLAVWKKTSFGEGIVSIAGPEAFMAVRITVNMPEPAIFTNVQASQLTPGIVGPDIFSNVKVVDWLPQPAIFSGSATMLSCQRIIRPGTFDGASGKSILQ